MSTTQAGPPVECDTVAPIKELWFCAKPLMTVTKTYLLLSSILCITFLIAPHVVPTESHTSPVANQNELNLSTPEDFKVEFASVPCENEKRLGAVKSLFENMGANATDVTVDKYKNVENLIIRKQGSSDDKIIVGAHYDKVADGCGAIDNWTGVVTLAHVYKTLKDIPLKHTILFVAFGKEEKGLVGSRAMVDAIPKDQLTQYCDMINIDSLGLAAPQLADNMSSKKLSTFVAELAKEMKISLRRATIQGADGDSSSFVRKGIPAVLVHGLSNDWASIIHTRNDRSAKVNPVSVYLGYRLVLRTVVRLDGSACGEYRDK